MTVCQTRFEGKVVHVVDNSVTVDGRVMKSAASGVKAGFDVVVLGRSLEASDTSFEHNDGFGVRLLEISTDLRDRTLYHSLRDGPTLGVLRSKLVNLVRSAVAKKPDRYRGQIRLLSLKIQDRRESYLALSSDLLDARSRTLGLARKGLRVMWISWRALQRARLTFLKWRLGRIPNSGVLKRDDLSPFEHFVATRFPRTFWRLNDPWVRDWMQPMCKALEAEAPEVIHAHDVRGLAAAVTFKRMCYSRRSAVLPRVVADVHEWWPGVAWASERHREAMVRVQDEFILEADSLVTVSTTLAELIKARYGLHAEIVPNFPLKNSSTSSASTVRNRLFGLSKDDVLAVYSGSLAAPRGIEEILSALTRFPKIHLVLVVSGNSSYLESLRSIARRLGIRHRVHIVPYVSQSEITKFIHDADFALIPFRRALNHEISLPSKFAEYILAGLPILSTCYGEVGKAVISERVGVTFDPERSESLAQGLESIVAQAHDIRHEMQARQAEFLDRFSWESFECNLMASYVPSLR